MAGHLSRPLLYDDAMRRPSSFTEKLLPSVPYRMESKFEKV
jgi:hypothetical protein